MYNNFLVRIIIVSVTVAVFGLFLFIGINSGRSQAQSAAVLHNARALADGLDYFFQDQQRFPTEVEIADSNLMRQYASPYPPVSWPSQKCPVNFVYQRSFAKQYNLQFCIASSNSGLTAGSHDFSIKK